MGRVEGGSEGGEGEEGGGAEGRGQVEGGGAGRGGENPEELLFLPTSNVHKKLVSQLKDHQTSRILLDKKQFFFSLVSF